MILRQGRNRIWDPWKLLGIPAAVVAILAISGILIRWNQQRQQINALLKTAGEYAENDDYDSAIPKLDEALRLRPGDKLLRFKRLELDTFRMAADYDQNHRLQDKQVLKQLQDNCKQLRNELGDDVRILALCGIVEELSDRPTKAIEDFYQRASGLDVSRTYPNVYNYWGYTLLKWHIGGKNWVKDALDKFSLSTSANPKYVWSFVNTAAVYLQQEDPESAKPSLETATKLLPNNPRIHQLWATYYLQTGKRLKEHHLRESYQTIAKGVEELEQAKDENPSLGDVRDNLGGALEELGGREGDAFTEYKEATVKDKWNIQACLDYARVLRKHDRGSSCSEYRRCQAVAAQLRDDETARINGTIDTAAREWLSEESAKNEQIEAAARLFRASRCK